MIDVVLSELGGKSDAPTLLVGPSLGTDVRQLWAPVVALLSERLRVVGWDLPGHGASPPAESFSMSDVAAAVLAKASGSFHYAGVSAGGAVGLHVALAAPERVNSAVLVCTGARIGTPQAWDQRAALVARWGMKGVVDISAERWFAPGFRDGQRLLDGLLSVDPGSYASACRALGAHDVRARLHEINTPVLAVAGSMDLATPVDKLEEIAVGVVHGELRVIEGVAHLPTIEAPGQVAQLITQSHPQPGAARPLVE